MTPLRLALGLGGLTSRFWFGGKWVVTSAPPRPWAFHRLGVVPRHP